MSELKRCPFCGGEAEFFEGRNWDEFFVGCTKCFCRTRNFATEKSARLIWNNRKPMDDIVERLEELRLAEYDDSDEVPMYSDCEEAFYDGESQGRYHAYVRAIKIVKGEV